MDIITERTERMMRLADIALGRVKVLRPSSWSTIPIVLGRVKALRPRHWSKTPLEKSFEKFFHRHMRPEERRAFRLTGEKP